jgi:hypothetical protein
MINLVFYPYERTHAPDLENNLIRSFPLWFPMLFFRGTF